MKIASKICLVLAVISPVFAARGTRKVRRRAQEDVTTTTAETAEEAAPEDLGFTGFNLGPPKIATPPTWPPTPPPATVPPEGAGDAAWQQYYEQTQPWDAYHTTEPWRPDKYMLHGDQARKSRSSGDNKKKSEDDSSADLPVDSVCQSFCQRYLETCENANAFFNPDEPRGTPARRRRRLIAGFDFEVPRLGGDGRSVFDGRSDCESACAGYPRPVNPADYLNPVSLGVNTIGDTYWCRNRHLQLAEADETGFGQQVHCPFASPSGGGLCTNIVLQPFDREGEGSVALGFNTTAWEYIRAGTETARHLGYCMMYFNDLVADCTNAGIDDLTFQQALQLIPVETEVLILNNNVGKRNPATGTVIGRGITEIPDLIFRNLICPECILALIMDDGNIETVGPSAFTALINLASLSLNMQLISEIPAEIVTNNVLLREFSMYNTRNRPGLLTSVPATLFNRNIIMQRVVISGHRSLQTLPASLFANVNDDISFVTIVILSNNGLTNTGVDNRMFRNLNRMQIFDLSNNQFETGEAAWFVDGWAASLRRFYLHSNPMDDLEATIFDLIPFLEVVTLHDTDLRTIPVSVFDNNDFLISYTLSPRIQTSNNP